MLLQVLNKADLPLSEPVEFRGHGIEHLLLPAKNVGYFDGPTYAVIWDRGVMVERGLCEPTPTKFGPHDRFALTTYK